MVGLTISTLIVGAAAGVFVTTLSSWERGAERQRLLQVARTTADLIERCLRSAQPPDEAGRAVFYGYDLSSETAAGHRLVLLSSAVGRIPRSQPLTDSSEIEFILDPEDGLGFTVRVDSTPDDDPYAGGYTISLSPLIQAFGIQYFDGRAWTPEWFESTLPLAVEFRLMIADPAKVSPVTGRPSGLDVSRLVTLPAARQTLSEEAALP